MTTISTERATRALVSDRVDTIGWGLLFVAIGAVNLMPGMPDGAWLIAAGIVMLGASAVRASMRLRVTASRPSWASLLWPPASSPSRASQPRSAPSSSSCSA